MADDPFATFAARTLQATAFEPREAVQEELAFAASLTSFRRHHENGWGGSNARGETLRVAPGYLERMTPNAFASAEGGLHFIGMHQALLVTMIDLALFAFTQRDLFPTIGNAAGEESPRPAHGGVPGLYLLELTERGDLVRPDLASHRVPQDADRHVMAVYLAMHMARFVWEHELAHCRQGHVLFLQREASAPHLVEAPFTADLVTRSVSRFERNELRTIRHSFELDADAEAIRNCLAIQLHDIENIPGIAAHPPGLRIQMAIFGAYLMTWLFEAYTRHSDLAAGESHPLPVTRLASLQGQVREILGCLEDFDAFHADLAAQFETLLNAVGVETDIHSPGISGLTSTYPTDALLAPYRFETPI